ncbi:Vinexin [Phlyctochytrium bullatum]|nr:Vinexin [Phlyctochytrium bullatum]
MSSAATTAATAGTGTSRCFSLAGSTQCPDYANYSVVAEGNIVDVASFDAYMANQSDTSASFIQLFRTSFGCPGFNGQMIRYHRSMLCNFVSIMLSRLQKAASNLMNPLQFIDVSQTTCSTLNKAPYMPMCQNSCLQFINSVSDLFNTSSVCTAAPDASAARNRTVFLTPGRNPTANNLFYEYCNSLTSNSTLTCNQGLTAEVGALGFVSADDTIAFCKKTMTATNDTNCPVFLDTFSKAVVKLLDPPNQFPWIASGIAMGVMGLIYLMALCCTCSKRWTKATTIAHQPPAEPEPGFTGTIARGASNTIRRSQIMNYGTADKPGSKRTSIFQSMRQSFRSNQGKMPPLPTFQTSAGAAGGFDPRATATDESSLLVRMRAVENYPAQLSDELDLRRGDIVIIEEMFDDGWAIGRNEQTGQSGALPLSCLVPVNQKGGNGGNRRSVVNQRTASLYAGRPDN